jgi:type IV fimbrial biogenesis protein FimT
MPQQGFSLIELLMGLAIATIVLLWISPTFKDVIQSSQREEAAQALISGLSHARSEAVTRNQTLLIHGINEDWSQGWRIIADISGQGHEDRSNPLLVERQGDARVPVVGNRPVQHFIRFSSAGEPLLPSGAFQAGTLHICDGREALSHHQIVLSRTGRISLRSEKAEQALCVAGQASQQGFDP